MTTDIRTILDSARRREAVVRLCLRGDLIPVYEQLDADLTRRTVTEQWDTDQPADEAAALAAEIEAVRAEMEQDSITVRFRALKRLEWEALVEAHKKRHDDEPFNWSTFPPALIAACVVDPTMTPAEVDELLDVINESQREDLFNAAYTVNQESTAVPFSVSASAVSRWRERNSKQPEPGASPEASS